MKRETLFRGKSTTDNKWVYGGITSANHTLDSKTFIVSSCFIEGQEDGESLNYIEVLVETVGQFTGFSDAGNSKIFEGDIIENDGVGYVVLWCEDSGCWQAKECFGDEDIFSLSEFAFDKYTWLQGNIHENSNLLTR